MISLNGSRVEIILACTAIESIALFAGVILSVHAPLGRRMVALAASTFSIYILNILRNGCAHGLRMELVWQGQL